MPIEVEGVYENGVLKLDHPLPLDEHARVKILVQPASVVRSNYGIIGWTGDAETVRRAALDPACGQTESP